MNVKINIEDIKDAVTNIENDELPDEGDIDICYKCTAIGIYDKALTVRILNADELKELGADMKELLPNLYEQICEIIIRNGNSELNRNFIIQ